MNGSQGVSAEAYPAILLPADYCYYYYCRQLDPKLSLLLFLGLCSHSHCGMIPLPPPSQRDPSNHKVRAVKQSSIAWAGNVSRIGDRRSAYRIFVGKHGGGGHVEDLVVCG